MPKTLQAWARKVIRSYDNLWKQREAIVLNLAELGAVGSQVHLKDIDSLTDKELADLVSFWHSATIKLDKYSILFESYHKDAKDTWSKLYSRLKQRQDNSPKKIVIEQPRSKTNE